MTVEIGLKHGRFAFIDDEDEPLVRQYGWWIALSRSAGGGVEYARGYIRGQRKQPLMHNLLTGLSLVDHINGDGPDNRRVNLRAATRSQNQWNRRKIYKPTSSRFKGVSMHPQVGRWTVNISQARAKHFVGLFDDEVEAALAYDAAARSRFGSFAAVNFPGPGERGALGPVTHCADAGVVRSNNRWDADGALIAGAN